MLQFTAISSQTPEKRDAKVRRKDFKEVYRAYSSEQLTEQSARCSQCGVPYCQIHCPLSNNIPDWLKLSTEGRMEEAYGFVSLTNNMPEICGRICPQDELCEKGCVLEQSDHGTVTIGSIERDITETAWKNNWVRPIIVPQKTNKRVAVIGAGPAGLVAAEELIGQGHDVDVFDRYDRLGGLLVYGIPDFKLEKNVVERRVNRLKEAGIRFFTNVDIGVEGEHSFSNLKKSYDAILIATGVYRGRELDIPGCDGEKVVKALDYLVASNRVCQGDVVEEFDSGALNCKGKSVVVIGGGDTAMDCVRTAVRQGASSVKCLYRRDRANMPGSQREVANAEEEGVEFVWMSLPKSVSEQSDQLQIEVAKTRMGSLDPETQRRMMEEVPGEGFTENCDLLIQALGFEPEDLPALFGDPALTVSRWGTVEADALMRTSLPGVFAAGDIVRGASLVVWAIADGRTAAKSIDQYLESEGANA